MSIATFPKHDFKYRVIKKVFLISHEPPSDSDSELSSDIYVDDLTSAFGTFLWKSCFFFLCFPLCYPCFLTRSVRRGRRAAQEKNIISEEIIEDKFNIWDKSCDGVHKTMSRQVSMVKEVSTNSQRRRRKQLQRIKE